MSSHILKIFLLCLGLLMVPLPAQAAVTVSTAAQLTAAVDEANGGGEQTILVADGAYDLSNMLYITGDSITIQGQSGDRDAVILRGQGMDGAVSHVFLVRGSHFTVRDMTIGWVYNHGIQIQGEEGASHVTVSNVRVVDCYEQLIKVSYNPANSNFSSHGLVEDSLLEYTAGIGPQYYIGGIDAHGSHNWIIRNNIFKNIASPANSLAEHAIHFWSGSADTLVEGNLIIDCDRGIGFGMGDRGHVRGVIRNNMIYHSTRNSAYGDVGIDLQSSTDVNVYNNTIFFQHDYPNAIEYRFAATTGGVIANNLTNKAIAGRDGATATVTHNVTSAAADWFVDPFEGDLHLAAADPAVLDQGTDAIPGLPSPFLDFDGEQRPAGSGIDIGADEFGADPIDPETVAFHILTDGSPNYTVPAGTYAHVYGTSLSNVITLESGAKARLINFPGQNAIQVQTGSNPFTVSRSGSVVTFQGSDGTVLKIPATSEAQTISFNGDESRVLQIHNNQVMLDDQVVTTTATPIENNQGTPDGLIKSSVLYDVAPIYSSADQASLVSGFSEFGLDFYHALRTETSKAGKNFFFSPYSIENALAMTWAGAENQTADQMAAVLRLHLPQNLFHPTLNALNIDFNSRDAQLPPSGDPFALNLVNAVWSRIGYPFVQDYLNVIAENYDAGIRTLDFMGNPDGSRQTINQWVEAQTNEKIKDLLPPGSISPVTAVVLTNAIYFKGSWYEKFDADRTTPGPFTLLDGTVVTAELMHRETDTRYYRGSGFDVVELPYASPEFSEYEYPRELAMLVIIPHNGVFESVESSLDKSGIGVIVDSLSMGTVNFTLPKFEFESEVKCSDILKGLGMSDAFEPFLADFSGMVNPIDSRPWIDEVYHKAFVAVDENGTEAAAATAVVMADLSIPEIVNISADKPFIFIIYDHFTRTILFMGRVLDPTFPG